MLRSTRYLYAIVISFCVCSMNSGLEGQVIIDGDPFVPAEIGPARAVAVAKDEKDDKKKKTDPKSTFARISKPLSDIVVMKWKQDKLEIDLPETYEEANGLFQKIREHDQNSWSSGSGNGDQFWVQNLQGQNLSGVVRRGTYNFGRGKKVNKEKIHVEFVETTGHSESIEIYGENANDFKIRVSGGLKNTIMQAGQSKSGFCVQYFDGEKGSSMNASTFESFCREHSGFLEAVLLPSLRAHGVGVPVTRYHPIARDQVLISITPPDQKRIEEFKKTFAGLDSKKFEDREAATKALDAKFEDWQDIIEMAVQSKEFSFEVRARAGEILSKKTPSENQDVVNLVSSAKLNEDAEYLVWMLSEIEESDPKRESKVTIITDHLQKLTQQTLGSDVEAWKEWAKKNSGTGGKEEVEVVSSSLAEALGFPTGMAVPTGNLLRLELEKEKLTLDRESWADQFGGKTIRALSTEIKKELNDRNLPKAWLNVRSNSGKDELDYPHVLFEHIQSAIQPNTEPVYYSNNLYSYNRSSLNRQYDQPHLVAKMQFHEIPPVLDGRWVQPKNSPEYFHYEVRERSERGLKMEFMEREDSSIRIIIGGLSAHSMLVVNQAKEGASSVNLFEGTELVSVQAENFGKLYQDNGKLFAEKVLPILARFGIQVGESLGGPLELKNTKPPAKKR